MARQISTKGTKAASLTSASISSLSTGNWTFTCNIIDTLKGRRLHDHNRDGHISISEAANEVKDAMNFVEGQQNGFALHGMKDSFQLSLVDSKAPALDKLPKPAQTFPLGTYVKLKHKRQRDSQTARIVGARDQKLKVEIQRYNHREVIEATPQQLSLYARPKLAKPKKMPPPMDAKEAAKKATMGGKYSDLLRKIPARMDYLQYGYEKDYGHYPVTDYLGHKDLPAGYWVYIYPDWYIFKTKKK